MVIFLDPEPGLRVVAAPAEATFRVAQFHQPGGSLRQRIRALQLLRPALPLVIEMVKKQLLRGRLPVQLLYPGQKIESESGAGLWE